MVNALLLGLNQVLIKLVNDGLQPVFQAGLRSVFAMLLIVAFALLMKRRLSIRDGTLMYGIICGLVFALEFIVLFSSLDFTSVARVSILFYTMPVWLAIGAHFLLPGERLTPMRVAGLTLCVTGMVVALMDRVGADDENRLLGEVLAIAAGICWAVIVLLVRGTALKKSSPEMQLIYQLGVSAVVLLPLSLLFGDLIREMTWTLTLIFAFQVVVVVAVGFTIWFWVLSVYPASATASYGFLAPLFGVFFGWLILDEQLTLAILAALVLVCAGIVLINRKPAA